MSSDRSAYTPESYSARNHQVIRARQHDIRQLPAPSETWIMQDVDLPEYRVAKLREHGIVKVVGSEEYLRNSKKRNVYRVAKGAQRIVDRIDPPPTPCDHTGIRNLRNGDYSCCRDECDVEFGREIAWMEVRR